MAEAGIRSVSLSIDGLEATHDALRGVPGSWRQALAALGHLRAAGMYVSVNTQINRRSMPELHALYDKLRETGIHSWQVQMTVPMGRAADQAELLLQPYEFLELFPLLAELAERGLADGIRLRPGNNVGYFGPYEALLRGAGDASEHWVGCQAGVQVLGIEADGAIKGCPSLPSQPYTGANIRDLSLAQIIETTEALGFNRKLLTEPERATEDLWGYCAGCYYAEVCRGGCSWTSHVFLGKRGNNPYCHHRALEHAKQGLRERVELVEAAPGQPFDYGLFRIVEEPLPAPVSPT
jgi:radical SAM protein with 4Fe4S-binding SPASM domain